MNRIAIETDSTEADRPPEPSGGRPARFRIRPGICRALFFAALLFPALGTGQTHSQGRVVDASSGAAVAGAIVRAEPGGVSETTDPEGRFDLPAGSELDELRVFALGYRPRTVSLEDLTDDPVIRLVRDVFDLAEITVSAERNRSELIDRPAKITVLTRAEMDRRIMHTIDDLVRYEPGVTVNRQTSGTDPFNSFGGFKIRGVSGNRVQMLVDGSRVQERIIDGTRDLVDPANMKAVEFARGPASVLWGSDALGGMVAFTTKDPDDYLTRSGDGQVFRFDGSYSDIDDGRVETLTGAVRRGAFDGLLSVTRRDTNEPERSLSRSPNGIWTCTRNPEATPCDAFDPTEVASNNVLGKGVWNVNPDHRLKLTGEFFGRDTRVDQRWALGPVRDFSGNVVAEQTSYTRDQELRRWRFSLEEEWAPERGLIDRLKWQFTVHPQRSDRMGDRRRTLEGGETEQRIDTLNFSERFAELDIQVNSSFRMGAMSHLLTWGFDGGLTSTDYERVDVTNNLTTGESEVARAGGFNFANADTWRLDGFVQDEVALGASGVSIIPGLRIAHYTIDPKPDADYQPVEGSGPGRIEETAVTPKIGVLFRDRMLSVYGQFARGFKMPTAQQLFTSLPGAFFVLVPNPDLEPEEVSSWEVGVRAEGDLGYFSLNGFYNDYTNFIQSFVFVPDTDPQEITYDNLTSVEIFGIEAAAGWRWSERFASTAALSWQRGDQQATPESENTTPFDSADPLNGTATLRFVDPETGLDAEVDVRFQAGTERVSGEDVFTPGGYAVYGLTLGWSPLRNVTLRGTVENLFDKRYLPSTATVYTSEPSSSDVAATNPIELQVQPGRNFRLGVSVVF